MSPETSVPYPGLRPFEECDAAYFYGQEKQQEALLSRLSSAHFVGVIGASGCGKSSLVRAGLMPLLRKQRDRDGARRWTIAVTHPGSHPVAQLARAIHELDVLPESSVEACEAALRRHSLSLLEILRESAGAGARFLIFVDQFEELFRHLRDRRTDATLNDASLYVKLLLDAARAPRSPVYIVTTMRSEYLEDCSEFYDLAGAMNEGLFLLPRMSRIQCEETITAPLEALQVAMQPALVQKLLNETEEREDGLPLLQHALRRLWNNWRDDAGGGNEIGLGHLRAPGDEPGETDVNRLLDAHLDSIYHELKRNGQGDEAVAEVCFRLLSEWDAKGKATRRPCLVQDVIDVSGATLAAVQRVFDAFQNEKLGRTFLRVVDAPEHPLAGGTTLCADDQLDVSHECLMRQWDRLGAWMVDEYQQSSRFRDLARAAELGLPLEKLSIARFVEWRRKYDPKPAWARRYSVFVEPGMGRVVISLKDALDFLKKNEKEQQKREGRQKRNKALIAAGVIGLLGAILSDVVYQSKQGEALAKERSDVALRLEKLTKGALTVSEGLRGELEKQKKKVDEQNVELQKALDDANSAHAGEVKAALAKREQELKLAVTNRQLEQATDQAAAQRLLDAAGQVYNDRPLALAIDLAAYEAATRSGASDIVDRSLWGLSYQLAKMSVKRTRETSTYRRVFAVSPDGRVAAVSPGEGPVRFWDLAKSVAGIPLRMAGEASQMQFDQPGRRLAVFGKDQRLRLYAVGASASSAPAKDIACDNCVLDETWTMTARATAQSIRLERLEGNEKAIDVPVPVEAGYPSVPVFLPGRGQLVFSTRTGLWLVSTQDGRVVAGPVGLNTARENQIDGIFPSPASASIAVAWRTRDGSRLDLYGSPVAGQSSLGSGSPLYACNSGMLRDVSFSQDGRKLILQCGESYHLIDVGSRGITHTLTDAEYCRWAAPDGSRIFVFSATTGSVRDAVSNAVLWSFYTGHDGVTRLAASAAGTVVSGHANGLVQTWDAATLSAGELMSGRIGPVDTLAVSRDGSTIGAGSEEGGVEVYRARGGEVLLRLPRPAGLTASRLALDAAGRRMLVTWGPPRYAGGPGGKNEVYSLAGGEVLRSSEGLATSDLRGDGKQYACLTEARVGTGPVQYKLTVTEVDSGRETVLPLPEPAVPEPGAGQARVYFSLTYNPDGKHLVLADNSSVYLIDAATGRPVDRLASEFYRPKAGETVNVAFSADSRLIAIGEYTPVVWGLNLKPFWHTYELSLTAYGLEFNGKGELRAFSAVQYSGFESVILQTDAEAVVAESKKLARKLTEAECKRYFADRPCPAR